MMMVPLLPFLIFFMSVGSAQTTEKRVSDKVFNTNKCRRCLDVFKNTYYCASEINDLGACCPFPKQVVGLDRLIDPRCIASP